MERPSNWQFDYSRCNNVTTLDGTHHASKDNLSELWSRFITMSKENERDLGHGYLSIGNRLTAEGDGRQVERECNSGKLKGE